MKNARIMRMVTIGFLSLLAIETTGQPYSSEAELNQSFWKLERGTWFAEMQYPEADSGFNCPESSNWEEESALQNPSGKFLPVCLVLYMLNSSIIRKGASYGMSDEELMSLMLGYEKGSFRSGGQIGAFEYFLSEEFIRGNINSNLKDDKKHVFPDGVLESDGALIHQTSFLSQPVIKLGFRF